MRVRRWGEREGQIQVYIDRDEHIGRAQGRSLDKTRDQ